MSKMPLNLSSANFTSVDYIIFSMTIVISLLIGVFFAVRARGRDTTDKFLLAGRKMRSLPVAISLLVTYESSIFVLGYPAEVYVHGFIFWFYNVGGIIGSIIIIRIAPTLFYPLEIKSVFEYIALRFQGNTVRVLAVILNIISMLTYSGIVLYGPAIALESVTNIPQSATILVLGIITVVYTSVGGLKAVIWTDVFQCVIIIAGILAVLIKGTIEAGGIQEVVSINKLSGRLAVDFDPNPMIRHTVWTLIIGEASRFMRISFSQSTIQRLKSTPTITDARKVLYIAAPGFFILQTLAMVQGLVAFAYFSTKRCDPLASKQINDPNQIIPFLVMDMFLSLPGVPGLFLAALCCASLSTISSMLSAISAIVVEDLVKPYKKTISDRALTMIAKICIPIYACLTIIIAFMTQQIGGPMSQIHSSISESVASPVTALFLLAIFVPYVTPGGVLLGGLFGFSFSVWLSAGYSFSETRLKTPWLTLGPTDSCPSLNTSMPWYIPEENLTVLSNYSAAIKIDSEATRGPEGIDWLYSISFQYFALMGICFTVVMSLICSFVTKRLMKRSYGSFAVERKYLLSFRETFLCCLPRPGAGRARFRQNNDHIVDHEQIRKQVETNLL